MIDPISAISLASAAFTGVKKAVQIGQDVEVIYKQLSVWSGHISDVQEYLSQEKKKPPLFKKLTFKKSATAEALDELALEKKVKEQEDAIRQLFTANWTNPHMGLDGYRKFIKVRREIKKKREKELYNQMRRRQAFIYNSKLCVGISALIVCLIFMMDFLWTAIVEASK